MKSPEVSPVIDVEYHNDLAVVALNNPATRNALSVGMCERLLEVLGDVAAKSRAMLFTGRGGSFCSGADLGPDIDPYRQDYDAGLAVETHYNKVILAMRDMPIPVVTALPGAIAGAGISLALLGDISIASEQAFFAPGFSRIGLVPDAGAMQLMIHAIGRPRTMHFMLSNERLDARQADAWGLVNKVVAADVLMQVALQWGHMLAAGPTVALGMLRALSWRSIEDDFRSVLDLERQMQRDAGRTADHRDGLASFVQKRPPVFVGH
jgi:2-(1,2-epoxy-1,2-dihydrophenyl)acetyl-CoA isomerase